MIDQAELREVAIMLVTALYKQGLVNQATYMGVLEKYA